MAEAGVVGFAMELLPHITCAQVTDVCRARPIRRLSRPDRAAAEFGRALPMNDRAGTGRPQTCSSSAPASPACRRCDRTPARRHRHATTCGGGEGQVESLGAKVIAVDDEEFKAAETAGGYAKEMSAGYQAKQAALVAEHIKKQDIVITTALIPGRPAPRLVSKDMVTSMRPGSVVVDLAVERGGNVEGVSADQVSEQTASRSSAIATWRAGSPPPLQASTPRT